MRLLDGILSPARDVTPGDCDEDCHGQWVNLSTTCAGEYVGLEEIDDGIWNVYFGPLRLGRLLERHMRIEDAYGRLERQHHL